MGYCITFECFSSTNLNDRADIILLQVPLAKSICLSGPRFIHHWKQEGFRTRGRSLRMTLHKGIAKPSYDVLLVSSFIVKLYVEKCPVILLTKGTGC